MLNNQARYLSPKNTLKYAVGLAINGAVCSIKGWHPYPSCHKKRPFDVFRTIDSGKNDCTIADTCRQGKTMKTLATKIKRLLQL